eukprot:1691787-Lingulodinium_polyedra.AAC.1
MRPFAAEPYRRHGEAAHPGPGVQLLTINITSLEEHWDWLIDRPEDVLCVQETGVLAAEVSQLQRRLRRAGWASVHVPARLTPAGRRTAGLAVLVRAPRAVVALDVQEQHLAPRVLHAAVQFDSIGVLHIFN